MVRVFSQTAKPLDSKVYLTELNSELRERLYDGETVLSTDTKVTPLPTGELLYTVTVVTDRQKVMKASFPLDYGGTASIGTQCGKG